MQFIHEYFGSDHRLTCGSVVGSWATDTEMASIEIGDNTYVAVTPNWPGPAMPADIALLLVWHNTSVV